MKKKVLICDGRCNHQGNCEGTVKPVEIFSDGDETYWGKYRYRDTAIQEDRHYGYTVNLLDQ
jgi:hypothetical protein